MPQISTWLPPSVTVTLEEQAKRLGLRRSQYILVLLHAHARQDIEIDVALVRRALGRPAPLANRAESRRRDGSRGGDRSD